MQPCLAGTLTEDGVLALSSPSITAFSQTGHIATLVFGFLAFRDAIALIHHALMMQYKPSNVGTRDDHAVRYSD